MHSTTNLTASVRVLAIVLVASIASASLAASDLAIVDNVVGSQADNYAVGRLVNSGGSMLADWTLFTTVSNTDFANFALTGGSEGLQYTFINAVNGSTDSNTIIFDVDPIAANGVVNIALTQSPYFDTPGTWNGGNSETAQFSVSWNGGGDATVFDPDNQFDGLTTGSTFASGSLIAFSGDMIFNSEDSWRIDLPTGVETVRVEWSSVNPNDNSDLTREWLTFETSVVPEPASGAVFGIAATFLLGSMRRRRRNG